MKNKKAAIFLSLLFPGLGHLYLGDYIDGVVFSAGACVLWLALFKRSAYLLAFNNFRSFLVCSALIFIYLYSLIDAYLKAK